MGDARDHWDKVYTAKTATAVSWYQPRSLHSLELIGGASPDHAASVIDVGGGASKLVDDLMAEGFADLSVLDISETALTLSKSRLSKKAENIEWIVADITKWKPARHWGVWHDRAVFHFLTKPEQQDAYIAALSAATTQGSTAIIATFAPDGPEKCSGLPVQRYNPESLATRIGSQFTLVARSYEVHKTPRQSEQRFVYAVLKRTHLTP